MEFQARKNWEGWGRGGGCSPPKIFAKVDLLLSESDSEKKNVAT